MKFDLKKSGSSQWEATKLHTRLWWRFWKPPLLSSPGPEEMCARGSESLKPPTFLDCIKVKIFPNFRTFSNKCFYWADSVWARIAKLLPDQNPLHQLQGPEVAGKKIRRHWSNQDSTCWFSRTGLSLPKDTPHTFAMESAIFQLTPTWTPPTMPSFKRWFIWWIPQSSPNPVAPQPDCLPFRFCTFWTTTTSFWRSTSKWWWKHADADNFISKFT